MSDDIESVPAPPTRVSRLTPEISARVDACIAAAIKVAPEGRGVKVSAPDYAMQRTMIRLFHERSRRAGYRGHTQCGTNYSFTFWIDSA